MPADVVVIGAGLAGLTAARSLAGRGLDVWVFDKARGPGGRMSTRRRDDRAWDHGAVAFCAEEPDFADEVAGWAEQGVVARWRPRTGGRADPELPRWVGVDRMSAITRALSTDVEVEPRTRIGALERGRKRRWRLRDVDGGSVTEADRVVVAVPAPQAAPLLAGVPSLGLLAAGSPMVPCWTVLATFAEPVAAPIDLWEADDPRFDPTPLARAVRNPSKPGRPPSETWVLQAGGAWSEQHLEDDAEDVAAAVERAFERLFEAAPLHADAHRWRFAFPGGGVGRRSLWDGRRGVGVVGDWVAGADRVELGVQAAWLSGRDVARQAG